MTRLRLDSKHRCVGNPIRCVCDFHCKLANNLIYDDPILYRQHNYVYIRIGYYDAINLTFEIQYVIAKPMFVIGKHCAVIVDLLDERFIFRLFNFCVED